MSAASSVAPVAQVQRRFQSAVMHERGASSARAFLRQLHPSTAMSAAERLDVYADSYFLRLRDVLKVDYPGVLHALGEETFTRVAREYVTRHPSRSFTLNDLGARFPGFLARISRVPVAMRRRDFLGELAILERAVEVVFHERLLPPVDVKKLRSIPAARWNDARFSLNPALRLLAFRHPVDPYLQAVLDGKKPRLPRPLASWVAVYRKDGRSWRARLTREQHDLLAALGRGRTLGAAIERAFTKSASDPERALARLGGWFREWTSEGFFVAIDATN